MSTRSDPTEWTKHRLRDLAARIDYGFTAKGREEFDGPRFLRITDIAQDNLDWDSVPFCDIPPEEGSRFDLLDGDIVIARTGATVGHAKQIRNLRERAVFASYLVRVRPCEWVDSDFLGLVVESASYKRWVLQVAGGVAQPNASARLLTDFEVRLPPIDQQEEIGRVWRTLNDLIENNRQRIELLKESLRLLYREWFVNFRYPGHEDVPLVESELGPIPEGWGTTSLDQRACLTRSSITPGDYPSEMFDHFSLPAFDEKSGPAVASGESIKSNKYLVDGECVLWSKLNPRFPRIWWVAPFITERRSVASTEFLVLTVNGGWRVPFIYSLVSSELFSLTMAARANGTSNSHQRVAPSDVMTYPILDPEDSIQERFSDLVEPFLQLESELIIQNRSLAQTRDLLLPRLVSGDLDISDLELDLEAVS